MVGYIFPPGHHGQQPGVPQQPLPPPQHLGAGGVTLDQQHIVPQGQIPVGIGTGITQQAQQPPVGTAKIQLQPPSNSNNGGSGGKQQPRWTPAGGDHSEVSEWYGFCTKNFAKFCICPRN